MKNYLSLSDLILPWRSATCPNPPRPPYAMHCCSPTSRCARTALGHRGGNPPAEPLVATADNYDRLGYSPDDVTRDSRYSRHVSPTALLRASLRPGSGLLDSLRERTGPLRPAARTAGLVYRRDAIDRTHVGAPHQADLWRIKARGLLGPPTCNHDGGRRGGGPPRGAASGRAGRSTPATHSYTDTGWHSTCSSPSRTAAGNGWNWPNAALSLRRSSAAPDLIRGAGPALPWGWDWTGH